MDTLVVRDFDTAIDAYIASWEKDFSWESIEFSEQTIFSIKLVGKQWDGRLGLQGSRICYKASESTHSGVW